MDIDKMEAKERFIQPFKSRISKKPITIGSRKIKGVWSKRLGDMGFGDLSLKEVTEEELNEFKNHICWGIAHRNYQILLPCISVYNDYDQSNERLYYEIDLYGKGKNLSDGHIHINNGDYLMFYMRMDEQKRKESILNRIALANVGLLVSYVKIEDISIVEVKGEVEVSYTITV